VTYFYTLIHSTFSVFFSHATATTEIYTLSLHDALPIFVRSDHLPERCQRFFIKAFGIYKIVDHFYFFLNFKILVRFIPQVFRYRSEEHTSELQSRENLVCRLLLEKKKKKNNNRTHNK